LHAAARARLRVPHRDHRGGAHAPASDCARHDTPDRTRTGSRSPRPPPRTSHGTRYIDGACAGECAVGQCSSRVGHDPAAAPDLITRRGGSRSRREVDLYYVAAEANSRTSIFFVWIASACRTSRQHSEILGFCSGREIDSYNGLERSPLKIWPRGSRRMRCAGTGPFSSARRYRGLPMVVAPMPRSR
jgi:hypothetical protein